MPSMYAIVVDILLSLLLLTLVLLKGGEGVFQLSILHIIATLMLMGWLSYQFKNREIRLHSFRGLLALAGFALMLVLSTLGSVYLYGSFFGVLEWFSYLVIFMVIYHLRRPFFESLTFYFIVAIGLGEAIYGLIQYYALGISRIAGTLTIANYFADLMILCIIVVVARAFFSESRLAWKIFGVVFVLLLGWAVYLSGSRGGLLTLATVFVLMIGLKNIRLAVAIALFVAIIIILVPNRLTERFREADIYSFTRVQIWQQGLHIIGNQPILGVGAANYPAYTKRYNFPVEAAVGRYAKSAHIAHNQYIQIAADFGLPALVLWLWFLIALLRQVQQTRPLTGEQIGLTLAIIALLGHGLIDNTLYTPVNALLFFVFCGHLAPRQSTRTTTITLDSPRGHIIYPLFLGIVIIVLLLFRPITEIMYLQALDAHQQENTDQAIRKLELAETLSPLNAKFSRQLALFYMHQYQNEPNPNWLELAGLAQERSLNHNPTNSDVALELVQTRYYQYKVQPDVTHFQAVIQAYEQALLWNGKNPFIWDKMGYYYAETENFNEALACFLKAIELEPNFVRGYQHAALVYQILGDTQKSDRYQRQFEEILAKDWTPIPLLPYEQRLLEPDTRTAQPQQNTLEN